ncbi:hypothetical protein HHK36_027797 [Tetracentron sinense]|uniref:Cytochrome P450 n=1 Tax=Tetracentron sinense TaxID=13715 RepID=A0A834YHB1_TETSI|nr:hypothetical protein HHK36_027797 [Tetracentron sinense]
MARMESGSYSLLFQTLIAQPSRKNQEAMKKVRAELKREIKETVIKESNLPHLPYLNACVKETMRLHPPTPFQIPHRAIDSYKVMNYSIPKDAQVLVNVWAIRLDPGIWENPLTFKPERFLNSDLEFKGNDFELLPFGAGRRICPGLPMAAKQIPFIPFYSRFFDPLLPLGSSTRYGPKRARHE